MQRPPVEMTNLIVSWYPEQQRRVLLCSHYDTRPIADQERNRANWTQPFVSANDGGSGVALLMELAHHVELLPATWVSILCCLMVRNSSSIREGTSTSSGPSITPRVSRSETAPRYLGGILFDMIAGHDAHFPVEPNSWFLAHRLVREVWGMAEEQDCDRFQPLGFSRLTTTTWLSIVPGFRRSTLSTSTTRTGIN